MLGLRPTLSSIPPMATHPHFLALEKQSAVAWRARLLHGDGQDGVVGAGVKRHVHGLDTVQAVRVQLLLGQVERSAVRSLRARVAPGSFCPGLPQPSSGLGLGVISPDPWTSVPCLFLGWGVFCIWGGVAAVWGVQGWSACLVLAFPQPGLAVTHCGVRWEGLPWSRCPVAGASHL